MEGLKDGTQNSKIQIPKSKIQKPKAKFPHLQIFKSSNLQILLLHHPGDTLSVYKLRPAHRALTVFDQTFWHKKSRPYGRLFYIISIKESEAQIGIIICMIRRIVGRLLAFVAHPVVICLRLRLVVRGGLRLLAAFVAA